MKRTKIIATIGPASADRDVLKAMVLEGLNVVRLNFSHGSFDDHLKVIQNIRSIDDELNMNTAILADLQGPKIRVGDFEGDGIILKNGEEITIKATSDIGNEKLITTNYKAFAKDVNPGEMILLDDGKYQLEVLSTDRVDSVKTRVIHGGKLTSRKGINLPLTKISLPCLTEKDMKDLEFALEHNVDWVGLSFVRTPQDILDLKQIIAEKNKHALVVAKIEKPEAITHSEEIIKATDAVMIARGDMGVEIPMQQVPLVQKSLIKDCIRHSRPVIVATQMMESMITSVTPTRAEVNDVANAVLDGADAVMLSAETSVGEFPVKVIEAMCKIVKEIELNSSIYYHEQAPEESAQERFITDSVCYNACRLSKRVEAKSIITMTFSGYTGFKVASQRPRADIYVFTANRKILKLMSLVWGVQTFYYDKMVSTDHTISDIMNLLKDSGHIKTDDYVINIASMPISAQGMSNMLKLTKA